MIFIKIHYHILINILKEFEKKSIVLITFELHIEGNLKLYKE